MTFHQLTCIAAYALCACTFTGIAVSFIKRRLRAFTTPLMKARGAKPKHVGLGQ